MHHSMHRACVRWDARLVPGQTDSSQHGFYRAPEAVQLLRNWGLNQLPATLASCHCGIAWGISYRAGTADD